MTHSNDPIIAFELALDASYHNMVNINPHIRVTEDLFRLVFTLGYVAHVRYEINEIKIDKS